MTAPTLDQHREVAAAGAALLDARGPWADRIDLVRLDMASCRDCVLGQLYGWYSSGRAALDLSTSAAELYGFVFTCDADDSDDCVSCGPQYPLLTEAWRDEIASRLEDFDVPSTSDWAGRLEESSDGAS
jgi:hypothetical protein